MCGIFAYSGRQNATPILLDGLRALEYRGYDSAGIFVSGAGRVVAVGAVDKLKPKIPPNFEGESGIAHLRWATHGEPTEQNAHPHRDCQGDVWVAHNGIVENFRELKEELVSKGHVFTSETDTEVLAHLVEEELKQESVFEQAVIRALNRVRGTYGLLVARESEPGKIVAARMGAPVVLGLGEGENFVASDPSPILRYTKSVVYLADGEVAAVTATTHRIFTLDRRVVERDSELLEWDVSQAQKGGYEDFMLKEIMEGPEVVRNTLRGRLIESEGLAKLGGLESVVERLRSVKRMIVVGCGTAYYAGLVGEYMLEEYAGLPVEVEIGSEFRYRRPVVDEHTVLLAVSQSGETADTLEAVREGKRRGAMTLGIVNTVGSTIARETEAGVYNHAGPEIGVASTKAFISQLTAFALFTLFLGRQRNMTLSTGQEFVRELLLLPEKIERILKRAGEIKLLAKKYAGYRDFLYIGRKYNYPIAYEGALKLKEVSYIHAEGYGAGEMKHGPLAMINQDFPTLAIAPRDSVYEKMLSNIQEIRARKGKVLAFGTEGDHKLKELAGDIFLVPETLEPLSPILSIVPLQLFAYYVAKEKGTDVDRPRNLAKSVTVE